MSLSNLRIIYRREVTLTIYEGINTSSLNGSGEILLIDYAAKFEESLLFRQRGVKNTSFVDLLTSVSLGVDALQSYINLKAIVFNNQNKKKVFDIENDNRLKNMISNRRLQITGVDIKKSYPNEWRVFTELYKLNNENKKHTITGSQAISFKNMCSIADNFRVGISRLLMFLHLSFRDIIPSKIIRRCYLPDVFIDYSG